MEKIVNKVYEVDSINLPESVALGNRIPKDFFITKGYGESDICIHAGSFHLALKNAGIEKANILTYSSVLPPISQQIERPNDILFGSVMESIMAVANGSTGEHLSAGIKLGWLYHKKTGKKFGGLVCEYSGVCSEEELERILSLSLIELYKYSFEHEYTLKDELLVKKSFTPKKQYGTVLVGLCFINHIYPIIKNV